MIRYACRDQVGVVQTKNKQCETLNKVDDNSKRVFFSKLQWYDMTLIVKNVPDMTVPKKQI